jgi:hypothetical protein
MRWGRALDPRISGCAGGQRQRQLLDGMEECAATKTTDEAREMCKSRAGNNAQMYGWVCLRRRRSAREECCFRGGQHKRLGRAENQRSTVATDWKQSGMNGI